jgi:hypothetical protein
VHPFQGGLQGEHAGGIDDALQGDLVAGVLQAADEAAPPVVAGGTADLHVQQEVV